MNKIILLLFIIFTLSCREEDPSITWTIKYVVFYPNHMDTMVHSGHTPYYWSSDRGSNYIKKWDITGPDIYNGSAPYKILSYTKE